MIFAYISGKYADQTRIEELNKRLRKARDPKEKNGLSLTDEILLIPTECHILNSRGKEAMCLEIRKSPEEPESKVSAVIRIIKENLTVGANTDWMEMPFA